MKATRIIFILIAAAAIFSTACDDLLSDLLKFNSQWYAVEFSINPSDEVGDLVFVTDEIYANVDSVLIANGVDTANLKSVRMSDARVTVLTEGYTFDPITSMELFMETPTLGKTRIAWLDTVPRGEIMIELDLNKDDLKDYILEDRFIFTAKGHLDSGVPEKIDFLAEFRYVMQGGLPN
jgi:hypothetical protein